MSGKFKAGVLLFLGFSWPSDVKLVQKGKLTVGCMVDIGRYMVIFYAWKSSQIVPLSI